MPLVMFKSTMLNVHPAAIVHIPNFTMSNTADPNVVKKLEKTIQKEAKAEEKTSNMH